MLQIHEKIKQARLSANLTEEELAKKIGVKRSTYQYWEVVTPSVAKIKEVAKALGKHEDYFFTNDENFVDSGQKKEANKDPMQIIANLSESNRIHAEAYLKMAEAQLILANKINADKSKPAVKSGNHR